MKQIQMLIREHMLTINLSIIACGFIAIVIELIFAGHMSGAQQIGFYTAALGGLLAIHGLMDVKARQYLAIIFLVLAIFGLIGAVEHFGARQIKETLAITQQMEGGANEPVRIISPPLMAPLSLSGLALFAVITLFAAEKPKNPSEILSS
jgi:hypothetical protein